MTITERRFWYFKARELKFGELAVHVYKKSHWKFHSKSFIFLRYKVLKLMHTWMWNKQSRSESDSLTRRYGESVTPWLADTGSRRLPDSPIRGVSDSLTHRYGESATPQLSDMESRRLPDSPIRGVYKRKNNSLRSLCVPDVAGISDSLESIPELVKRFQIRAQTQPRNRFQGTNSASQCSLSPYLWTVREL